MGQRVKLGANLSLTDFGGSPDTVRAFGWTAEDLGYDHVAVPDHLLGRDGVAQELIQRPPSMASPAK